jgi:hypothetical protein
MCRTENANERNSNVLLSRYAESATLRMRILVSK